jgi:hypothetical protein
MGTGKYGTKALSGAKPTRPSWGAGGACAIPIGVNRLCVALQESLMVGGLGNILNELKFLKFPPGASHIQS